MTRREPVRDAKQDGAKQWVCSVCRRCLVERGGAFVPAGGAANQNDGADQSKPSQACQQQQQGQPRAVGALGRSMLPAAGLSDVNKLQCAGRTR